MNIPRVKSKPKFGILPILRNFNRKQFMLLTNLTMTIKVIFIHPVSWFLNNLPLFHYFNLYFQPPRSAHPVVKFTCSSQEPMVIDNLPFDKYELEPSPLTQFILARKQPTICWQVCDISTFLWLQSCLLTFGLTTIPFRYIIISII